MSKANSIAVQAIMIPVVQTVKTLGLMGSRCSLILPYSGINLANVLVGSVAKLRTLPLGVLFFQGQFTTDWGNMGATMTMASLPGYPGLCPVQQAGGARDDHRRRREGLRTRQRDTGNARNPSCKHQM